jgi:predicted MFS family arabinose efflux permease
MSRKKRTALSAAAAGLISLSIAIGIGRFVYTPILPVMAKALGLSRFVTGLLASANFAGYLAGALFAAGRLPGARHAWLVGALAASAITTGAMGFTTALPMLLALRFAGGVASALGLVLASAIVLEVLVETGRVRLSSLLFAGVGAGIAVSAVLVSVLRAAGIGWAGMWVASGTLSLLGAAAVGLLIPAGKATPGGTRGGRTLVTAALLRLIIAYGLFGFGYVITATFLVAIVRADPHLRVLEPVIWVVVGLAATPSVALWTRIAGKTGLARAFALASLVEAIGVEASVAWRTETGIFLAAVLLGGTFVGITALGLVRARAIAGGDGRQVLALMTSAFGLGQIIGPSFAGWLAQGRVGAAGGFGAPSAVAAGALVVAALLAGKG